MKKLPIGVQSFSKLIEENYTYIDKTHNIYDLVTQGSYYFFSRPRRFGKSLLVSTLAALFCGKKELFEGLAISALPYEWKEYPVVVISFADISYTSSEELELELRKYLQEIAQEYNISLDESSRPGFMLRILVKKLSVQNPVVLLIDEYDYSILQNIHNPVLAEQMREVLKNFYGVIKGLDQYLKFVLLTGVSQFSKTSIFSGLNNLEDISLSEEYNTLLGYTEKEITIFFEQHLLITAQKMNYSVKALLEEMTVWYDGYKFTKSSNATRMYNPFSVLLCLKKHEFSNYWFKSGTPTFLINLLKSKNYPLQDFELIEASEGELEKFEVENINLKTLLFQTGYLTIKDYNKDTRNYVLQSPNKENSVSLLEHVFTSMTQLSDTYLHNSATRLRKTFENDACDELYAAITQLFAEIPYAIHIEQERYYQTIFYIVLKMIGAQIVVEQLTNIGRIDAIVQTKTTCFIIEFKINSTAAKALQQIEDKKYYQPYMSLNKAITLVGIAFDTQSKNISEIEYKNLT